MTNVLSPGDNIISFLFGQFSLLWIDQMNRLNFNVDVIESEWGAGADLATLSKKLSADYSHSVKAVCIVHNETSTGVTNNLAAVRRVLGKPRKTIISISLNVQNLVIFCFLIIAFLSQQEMCAHLHVSPTPLSRGIGRMVACWSRLPVPNPRNFSLCRLGPRKP